MTSATKPRRSTAARRLSDRADELMRSGSAADKRVARELIVEARNRASAKLREIERASPAFRKLAKALAKPRKSKRRKC